jgi:hypothetical protein
LYIIERSSLEQLGPNLQEDFSMGLPMVVSRLQDSRLQSDGWMGGGMDEYKLLRSCTEWVMDVSSTAWIWM